MITPDWVRASVHTAVYTGIVFGGVGCFKSSADRRSDLRHDAAPYNESDVTMESDGVKMIVKPAASIYMDKALNVRFGSEGVRNPVEVGNILAQADRRRPRGEIDVKEAEDRWNYELQRRAKLSAPPKPWWRFGR